MDNPLLTGTKVYLRPLERADAPVLAGCLGGAAARRSLRLGRPPSVAEGEELIERVRQGGGDVVLGIVRRAGERLLGVAGLHRCGDGGRQAWFGISIGDPEEWGKGFGTEATGLLIGHGFAALGLERVWLHVDRDNRRAIRTYQKLGFREEEVPPPAALGQGRDRGVATMALRRLDWDHRSEPIA